MPAQEDQALTAPQFWGASFAILAVAAFLRLPSLAYESLWVDEFITLLISKAPLLSLPLEAAQRDSQPPLFYLLVRGINALGTNEVTLRLTSVLAGLATIPAIGWIAKQLSGCRAALIAMGILAISPFHVWYSLEARGYALVLFLLTLSVGFLLRAGGRSKSSRMAWFWFVATTALALYTHLMALPFLLVQVAVAIWVGRRKKRRIPRAGGLAALEDFAWHRILLGQCAALFMFLPGAILLFRHAWLHYLLPPTSVFLEGPTTTYALSPNGVAGLGAATAYGLFTLLAGFSLGPSVRELHDLSGSTLRGVFTPSVALFCVLVGVVAWFAFRSTRRRTPLGEAGFLWTATVLLVIPVAVFFAEAPFRPRYVAIALPGVVLWLAGGISGLKHPMIRSAIAVALLAALLISLTHRHAARYVKDDVRSAASYLLDTGETETTLVLSTRSMVDGLGFYLETESTEHPFEVRSYPSWGIVETQVEATEEFRGLLAETETAWLLLGRVWEADPQSLILSAARDTHQVEERGVWPGVQLYLVRPRTARP